MSRLRLADLIALPGRAWLSLKLLGPGRGRVVAKSDAASMLSALRLAEVVGALLAFLSPIGVWLVLGLPGGPAEVSIFVFGGSLGFVALLAQRVARRALSRPGEVRTRRALFFLALPIVLVAGGVVRAVALPDLEGHLASLPVVVAFPHRDVASTAPDEGVVGDHIVRRVCEGEDCVLHAGVFNVASQLVRSSETAPVGTGRLEVRRDDGARLLVITSGSQRWVFSDRRPFLRPPTALRFVRFVRPALWSVVMAAAGVALATWLLLRRSLPMPGPVGVVDERGFLPRDDGSSPVRVPGHRAGAVVALQSVTGSGEPYRDRVEGRAIVVAPLLAADVSARLTLATGALWLGLTPLWLQALVLVYRSL